MGMNEVIFLIHIVLMVGFVLGALRLGKGALVAFVAVAAMLANLLVLKQMKFFGLQVTCTDVYIVGSILGLNLLQEYYGKESARKASWICFFFLAFFAVMSFIHLSYLPTESDWAHGPYLAILKPAPRIFLASLGVFFAVQQFDIRFYGFLKGRWKAPLAVRTGTALIVSQLLDTVLFSFFGLYGLVASVWHVIMFSFFVKLFVIVASTPFVALSKRFKEVKS